MSPTATLEIPADLRPSDGRFGAGPSKVRPAQLQHLADSGVEIMVRKAANLHTGGSIHDVTAEAHPSLVAAACAASRAIDIPVVGIDFIVKSASQPDYIFIEANERPGLANHEPQPTAERFVDLLFPMSGQKAAARALGR